MMHQSLVAYQTDNNKPRAEGGGEGDSLTNVPVDYKPHQVPCLSMVHYQGRILLIQFYTRCLPIGLCRNAGIKSYQECKIQV